jgi:cysteine-rich repeat protein
VLVPRDTGGAQWGASAVVEVGVRATDMNDPIHGNCVGSATAMGPAPEWIMTEIPARCGDGVRQTDEGRDDGNRAAGDGCGPFCVKEQ